MTTRMPSTLDTEPVRSALRRLHARARDEHAAARRQPRLAPGALVVADLNRDDPDLLAYQRHVRAAGAGFHSVTVPLDTGVELTVHT